MLHESSITVGIYSNKQFEGGAYLNIVPDNFTFSIFLFNVTLSICKFPMDWY